MTLKAISLNLWWGGKLMDEIIAFLQSQEADILILQEVSQAADPSLEPRFHSVKTLQQHLDYPYAQFDQAFVNDNTVGKIPHGNAVLAKFPITQTGLHFFVEPDRDSYKDIPEMWPIEPRILQHVALDTPGGEVNVFNIHGIWDLNGDNYSDARRRMSEETIAAVKGKPNVILAGDSNAKYSNQAIRNLEGPLKNAFPFDLKTTFNMRRKDNPGYATAAVDIMFVSNNIEVLAADCPEVDISDHLPLVATLRLP